MHKIFSHITIKRIMLLVIVCISLGLLLKPGLPAGHDTYAHATYSKIFFHSLTQGQFPVRWVEHAWIGFGQPLFNYYQVGFFYLVSAFHLVMPTLTSAIKTAVLFIWLLGGGFIYLFTKKYGQHSAFIAFTVYMLSPYILLDIFVRSSFPELTALSIIPGIFWAIDQLISTKKPIYIAILATLLGATFISHLPTVVLFSPLITLYTLYVLFENHSNLQTWFMLCSAVLLGIGLSAFYVFPAVTELNLIQIQKMQTGQFNFNTNFVQPNNVWSYIWGYNGDWWGSSQPLSILLGITPWTIIIASLIFLVINFIKHRRISFHLLFWLFCIAYAYFFMHKLSAPIWNAIPIFSFFQFPWRFFMLIPISTAVLSAILSSRVSNLKRHTILILVACVITIATTIPFISSQQFLNLNYFNLPIAQWRQHPEAQYVAFWEPGYSPQGVGYIPQKKEFKSIWSFSGEGSVDEQSIKPHKVEVTIQANQQSTFTLNTPYFPYWQATLNGQSATITPADPYHFMNINLPPGNHHVTVEFKPPTTTLTAQMISLTSLIIVTFPILLHASHKMRTLGSQHGKI